MRISPPVLVCGLVGLLSLGCSSADNPGGGSPTGGAGDEGGSGEAGSGGSKPSGGSGGSTTPTGTGGTTPSGGSGGSTSGGAGGSGGSDAPDASAPVDAVAGGSDPDASTTPPVAGDAPYGCATCRRLFDGKTLDGWVTVPGAWEVKEGALASTGKANDIFTKEDIGDARIFFQVRQIKGDHKPCTTLFGNRPAGNSGSRGLGGAQFQPPNGANWNYGVGGTFTRLTNPNFNVAEWHQCEVLIKEAGSFRAACCPVGPTPCKGVEVLKWTGKGKKFPFNIMMHNGGLFDEYREIWIEDKPTLDGFLSQK
jgi:hypothetical protein